jgi:hypothetical protein
LSSVPASLDKKAGLTAAIYATPMFLLIALKENGSATF